MQAYIQDLSELNSAGLLQSLGTAEFLYSWEQLSRYSLAEKIAIYGVFVGVILYFSYAVFQHRRQTA